MDCKKIGIFIEDEWVASSYYVIIKELKLAGYLPLLITTNKEWDGGMRKSIPTEKGEPVYYIQADLSMDEVNIDDFAGFVFGGGYWADRLRWWFMKTNQDNTLERPLPKELIIKALSSSGCKIGVICHSMWILCSLKQAVSAISGKKVTCAYNIIDDVKNAGFKYVDADVHVDGNLITGRMSSNSEDFIREYIRQLQTTGGLK